MNFYKFFKKSDSDKQTFEVGEIAIFKNVLVEIVDLSPNYKELGIDGLEGSSAIRVRVKNLNAINLIVDLENVQKWDGKDMDDKKAIFELLENKISEELEHITMDFNIIEFLDKVLHELCVSALKKNIILTKKEMAEIHKLIGYKFISLFDTIDKGFREEVGNVDHVPFTKRIIQVIDNEIKFLNDFINAE